MFAEEVRKAIGERPVYGTIANKKSGFIHIFKLYERNFDLLNSGEEAADLNIYMEGLKNRMVALAVETGGEIDNSRNPLSFTCYQILARSLLNHVPSQDQSSFIFAHLYLLLQ